MPLHIYYLKCTILLILHFLWWSLGIIFIHGYDTQLYPNGYNGFEVIEVTPKTSQHVEELTSFGLNSKVWTHFNFLINHTYFSSFQFFEFWEGISIGHPIPILTPPDKVVELETFLNTIGLEANITMNNIQDAIDHEKEPSRRKR